MHLKIGFFEIGTPPARPPQPIEQEVTPPVREQDRPWEERIALAEKRGHNQGSINQIVRNSNRALDARR